MTDWITTDEAAEISGYHIDHIRLLLRQKKVAAKKKGGAYWVDRQSLFDYLTTARDTDDRRLGPKGRPQADT